MPKHVSTQPARKGLKPDPSPPDSGTTTLSSDVTTEEPPVGVPSANDQWDEFRRLLQEQTNTNNWTKWLEPLGFEPHPQKLLIRAPSGLHMNWVKTHFSELLTDTASKTYGSDYPVEYGICSTFSSPESLLASDQDIDNNDYPAAFSTTRSNGHAKSMPNSNGSGPESPKAYRFDDFVVGKSNHFAFAAAQAVAEQPRDGRYNPLFLYAGAGLGKTHLLKAVGNYVDKHHPKLTVKYVTSEIFFSEFIEGIRRKRMDGFKQRYRSADVLLLDDVQFFEGKEQILEEFFHTFNTLYEYGKQMVISSDRHPRNLSTLEDRLRSRFGWGLLSDIQPPDIETRLAILRQNADAINTQVPEEVLDYIAGLVTANIRELEGALIRVTAFSQLTTGGEFTLDLAKKVLHDIHPGQESQRLNPEQIIMVTARQAGLGSEDLRGQSRKQPIALTRQIAMYLCRELTDLSLPRIGVSFGNRDHSTVLHACNKITQAIQTDRGVFDRVTELTQILRTNGQFSTT